MWPKGTTAKKTSICSYSRDRNGGWERGGEEGSAVVTFTHERTKDGGRTEYTFS